MEGLGFHILGFVFGVGVSALVFLWFRRRNEDLYQDDFYRDLYESLSDSVITINEKGVIQSFNESFLRAVDQKPETIHGADFSQFLSHSKLLMGSFLSSMARGDCPNNIEFSLVTGKGVLIPVLVSASARRRSKEKSYILLIKDIRSLMDAQKQLEDQRAVSLHAEKMASLGEMAGGVAHEINNPLGLIVGSVDRIRRLDERKQLTPELLNDGLEMIKKTGLRIAKIVRALRLLSRDGSNDPFEKTDLRSVIDETLEICRPKFHSRSIRFDLKMPESVVLVECRAMQIGQTLLNLLNNAADAVTDLEEKWIRVEIVDERENPTIQIRVIDSGPGIPAGIRDRILNPFFTTKEPGKGTGLGLSIARRLIESHRGQLWIDSTYRNTCFVIDLPRSEETILRNLA